MDFKDEKLFVLLKDYCEEGAVWVMRGLDQSHSDFIDLLEIARIMAMNGHQVVLLQSVHYKDPLYRAVYGDLYGSKYYRKCPDLLIDGKFFEYESFVTTNPKNALRNMLHNGLAQSDHLIIKDCNLSDGYILRSLRGLTQVGVDINEIWIYNEKTLRLIYKTEG